MSVSSAKLQSTLCQGAVYFAPTRDTNSPDCHFCVVVSEDPKSERLVLYEIVSSKVEKTKRRVELQGHYASSAVELGKPEVGFLPLPSVVDCNVCKEVSLSTFEQDLKMPQAYYAGRLPPGILKRIVHESLVSKGVKPDSKRKINKVRALALEKKAEDLKNGVMPSPEIKITVN